MENINGWVRLNAERPMRDGDYLCWICTDHYDYYDIVHFTSGNPWRYNTLFTAKEPVDYIVYWMEIPNVPEKEGQSDDRV